MDDFLLSLAVILNHSSFPLLLLNKGKNESLPTAVNDASWGGELCWNCGYYRVRVQEESQERFPLSFTKGHSFLARSDIFKKCTQFLVL